MTCYSSFLATAIPTTNVYRRTCYSSFLATGFFANMKWVWPAIPFSLLVWIVYQPWSVHCMATGFFANMKCLWPAIPVSLLVWIVYQPWNVSGMVVLFVYRMTCYSSFFAPAQSVWPAIFQFLCLYDLLYPFLCSAKDKILSILLPPSHFVCPLFYFGMSQNIVLFQKIKVISLLMFLLYP